MKATKRPSRSKGETRIYFAVPDTYSSGDAFESYKEAEDEARSRIQTFKYGGGIPDVKSREFVDVRISDDEGDRILHRVEVFAALALARGEA